MHERKHLMEKIDPDETKLFETRKHPIGIVLLYIEAVIGMILAVGLSYFLIPLVITDTDLAFNIANIFTAVAIMLAFIILTVATIIYRENRLIVTDKNITQVLQYGIFNRKVSQLNVENIEDVTSDQNGFLATIFGFGDLNIETAGEQVNFHFSYCPNADYYAKIILDAREKMLGQERERRTRDNRRFQSLDVATEEPKKTAEPTASALKGIGAETIKQASENNEY